MDPGCNWVYQSIVASGRLSENVWAHHCLIELAKDGHASKLPNMRPSVVLEAIDVELQNFETRRRHLVYNSSAKGKLIPQLSGEGEFAEASSPE